MKTFVYSLFVIFIMLVFILTIYFQNQLNDIYSGRAEAAMILWIMIIIIFPVFVIVFKLKMKYYEKISKRKNTENENLNDEYK